MPQRPKSNRSGEPTKGPQPRRKGPATPATTFSSEQAREFATILDLAHDAILVLDPKGKLRFWNQGAEQLYGFRRDEALGKSAHELLRTEFPVPLQEIVEQVRTSGEWRGDLLHRSRDGKRLVVASRWNAQFDAAGNLVGTFEINSDITEWKRFEEERARLIEEVRRAEERLRLAQRAANVWTWEYDIEADAVKRSDDVSHLYGLSEGMLGNKFETVLRHMHPEDQQRAREELRTALEDGEEHEMEYRVLRPDGRMAWILLRGRAHFDGGKAVRVLGIGMDITLRKRSEEALRATEKLAATGRLAATIAHELNNPLAAVANLLYLIEMDHSPGTQTKSYAQLALQELHRASNIVKQTLSFHRESHTPVLVKISDLLDGILALYQPKIAIAHVAVEKRFEFEGDVRGYPGELRQVFSNLIINALEAMGRNGRLVLHVFPGSDFHDGRRGVRVVIADTGPGIPEQARRRIFEPFFTTKGEKGTGLGLWVSHGIMERHSGSIRVHSSTRSNASGTVFSVFLPVEKQSAQARTRRRYEAGLRGPVQLTLPLAG